MRNRGTKTAGGGWTEAEKLQVWKKGVIVPGYDAADFRKDRCGAWMRFSDHGETSKNGWEMDHIIPVSRGGLDSIGNLQPLYWENNRHKADHYPDWDCLITAKE